MYPYQQPASRGIHPGPPGCWTWSDGVFASRGNPSGNFDLNRNQNTPAGAAPGGAHFGGRPYYPAHAARPSFALGASYTLPHLSSNGVPHSHFDLNIPNHIPYQSQTARSTQYPSYPSVNHHSLPSQAYFHSSTTQKVPYILPGGGGSCFLPQAQQQYYAKVSPPDLLQIPPDYSPPSPANFHHPYFGNSNLKMFTSDVERIVPATDSPGRMMDTPSSSSSNNHLLELHQISYIRSFTSGRWWAKVFNPPITAQFLKDVSLVLQGGEMMGIIGSQGAGKTTLLNVIARRVQGTTGGTILLNQHTLTERVFQNSCCYVSFKQSLIPELTVEETLIYQAQLGLAPSVSHLEKRERLNQIISDFELESDRKRRVRDLNSTCRRRVLLAMHLIRDPLLILMDDPCRSLSPLGAYQLLHQLHCYVKKHNRLAVLSATVPRSDIYPLLDRVTLLFYGEVVFSGYTKQMPHYFRHIGYPCPASENPAVYFLCLATLDRETSERYMETQRQAVHLIETFKNEGAPYYRSIIATEYPNYYVPLSNLGRPGALTKFFVLVKRSLLTQTRSGLLVARFLLLPLFGLLLFLFVFQLRVGPTAPITRAGLNFNALTAVAMVGASLIAPSYSVMRRRYFQDSWDNLYGGGTFVASQLLVYFILDLFPLFGFSGIVYWACGMGASLVDFMVLAGVLWCCYQFSQVQTLCLMGVLGSAFSGALISMAILMLQLCTAGGFLKSIRDYRSGPMDWLYFITYASPFRFAASHLAHLTVLPINATGCSLPGSAGAGTQRALGSLPPCRWATGHDYLSEIYYPRDYEQPWLNFGLCWSFLAVIVIFCVLLHTIPMPHCVKRKFRTK